MASASSEWMPFTIFRRLSKKSSAEVELVLIELLEGLVAEEAVQRGFAAGEEACQLLHGFFLRPGQAFQQGRLFPGHAEAAVGQDGRDRRAGLLRHGELQHVLSGIPEGPEGFPAVGQSVRAQREGIKEEVAAMLDDVVHRQINQPHVEGAVLLHEHFPQMVDGGIGFVVVLVLVVRVAEQGVPLLDVLVLRQVAAVIEALEKARVLLRDGLREKLLQKVDPAGPALGAASGGAEGPPVRGGLPLVEEAHAPQGFPALFHHVVPVVCDGPAHGIGAHIEPQIPALVCLFLRHA